MNTMVLKTTRKSSVALSEETLRLIDAFREDIGNSTKSSAIVLCLRAIAESKRQGSLARKNLDLSPFLVDPKGELSTRTLSLSSEDWSLAEELARDFGVATLNRTILIAFRVLRKLRKDGCLDATIRAIIFG
jgi:hypothetical protein